MSTNREVLEKKRYERLLFDYGTTTLTDYRDFGIPPNVKTEYKEKPPKQRSTDTRVKDINTLCHFQIHMPFYAFFKPKGIVDTNPYTVQKEYSKLDDEERDEAIKTRPRLVMTPALSIDDVPEPQRSMLIQQSYTSEMATRNNEVAEGARRFNVQAPLPGLPAPPRPVARSLPKLTLPMVPYEWRMESCKWDRRQLRASRDAAQEFWMRRPLNRCPPCDQSARLKAMGKTL